MQGDLPKNLNTSQIKIPEPGKTPNIRGSDAGHNAGHFNCVPHWGILQSPDLKIAPMNLTVKTGDTFYDQSTQSWTTSDTSPGPLPVLSPGHGVLAIPFPLH